MLDKKHNINFAIKLGLLYFAGSIVLLGSTGLVLGQDSFSLININSFLVGAVLVLSNFFLSAYDLNKFIESEKKSVFISKNFARYVALFLIVYILNKRFDLNIIVVAFEIMSFQLSTIFINMFGLSGLLLKKE